MATDVVMPQMGESIAEGTIVRWIKKVGDTVDRDEPLFEISTDKVDTEVPSPAAGVVSEIRVKEGETVPVNSVVAVIGGGSASAAPQSSAASAGQIREAADSGAAKAQEAPKRSAQAEGSASATSDRGAASAGSVAPAGRPEDAGRHEDEARPLRTAEAGPKSTEDAIRERSSPLVRKIAKEHRVDISQIHGSGIAGRVTKDDILAFIAGQEGRKAEGQEFKAGRQEGRTERLEGR